MTTTNLIDALTALSCDAYTVTATVRGDTIVASYRTTAADLAQAETDGADASARIAEVLEAAGYTFGDAGGDDPGIYEVWHAPAPKTPEYHLHHAGKPLFGDGNAYHMGDRDPVSFDDLDDAIRAAQSLDETCGWDIDVVEVRGLSDRTIAWGH